jgi:hypothetical protein
MVCIIMLFVTLTQNIFLNRMLTFTFLWRGRWDEGRLVAFFSRIQSSGLLHTQVVLIQHKQSDYVKLFQMRFVDIGGIVDHHCFSFLS